MKLYVPSKIILDEDEEDEDDENKKNGEVISRKSSNSQGISKFRDAEQLKEEINKITNTNNLGDSIAILTEVTMVTPRGKINIHFLKSIFKITGPSNDYKIPYNNINRAFILPKQDGVNMAFVVGLTTPMRQGNTNYPFIVFQLKKGTEVDVTLNLPPVDSNDYKKVIKNPIDSELNGDLYDIMAKLFKSIIGIGVIIPGKFKR